MKIRKSVVAFQGAPGAFSHKAAQQLFSEGVEVKPCQTFAEIFEAITSDAVTHGVVPIENTLHGSIHENYDNLLRYEVKIFGETTVRISHHLITPPGVAFRSLKRVFSHPVALNQCRIFLQKHKRLEALSYYDTAGSVQMIMTDRPPNAAAIASETAAKIYGGTILKRNVEDNSQNFTRFFLLAKQDSKPATSRSESGTWKTSLVFAVENSPGMLFRAMACFALRDINLSKIESRPNREKPWEYMFYVDIVGRSDDPAVQRALAQLQEISSFSRILGTYCPQNS
ncbi:MAG: prephenate dehydratase [Bryobacteraceae bacterium]